MSKKFKSQDHFRYKKLGKRWRKPVGLQSKLRIGKGGSGRSPAIGRGTAASVKYKMRGVDYLIVNNVNNLETAGGRAVLIAGGVGGKKTFEIASAAQNMGLRVLNMNKVKRAKRISQRLEKKTEGKKEKGGKAKTTETKQETKQEAKKEEQSPPATK